MSPVTLPGDLVSPVAGPLLRRGCIVRGLPPFGGDTMTSQIVALYPTADGESWTCGPLNAQQHTSMMERTVDLVLDLSDPAGMDIAARWLAAHHGLTVGATAPGWSRADSGVWALSPDGPSVFFAEYGRTDERLLCVHRVPGISALTDPAEALRAACLAAVGRAG